MTRQTLVSRASQIEATHAARIRGKELPKPGPFDPVGLHARDIYCARHLVRALSVMVTDRKIKRFLLENDPQALGQARAALALWFDFDSEMRKPEAL